MAPAPFVVAATLAPLLGGAAALAQEKVSPVVADRSEPPAQGQRQVDQATHDGLRTGLTDRTPVTGGGFRAGAVLGHPLRAHSGEAIGPIVDIAFDASAQARFFLVRLADDTERAVPVGSVMVDGEERLLTDLKPAEIDALPRPGPTEG